VSSALASDHGCRHIILVDRCRQNILDKFHNVMTQKVSPHSTRFTAISCNVGHEQQVQEMMYEAFRRDCSQTTINGKDEEEDPLAPPSILIKCAGITRDSFITKMTMEQWKDVMDVNLTGTFLTCREFIRQHNEMTLTMQNNSNNNNSTRATTKTTTTTTASIVNVGSVVGQYGNMGQANYAASKGGVVGLTRALAQEMATSGIRVNAVIPGFIDTPMVEAVPDKVKKQMSSKIALERLGTPQDVANLILFLASCERSGYLTGECVECSGKIAL